MTHVLITGGAGFIGSALALRLVREGHPVRVLDDESRGSMRRLAGVSVEFASADIRDPDAVRRAAKGADRVVHLAAVNGTEFFYSKPELVLDVGVRGMLNVLDACLEHRVPELVVVSSSEVYQQPPRIPTDETAPLSIPDPRNPRYSYAASKIISEILAIHSCRKKHFERVVIVRPHNVYGPDMGWEHVLPQFVIRMHRLPPGASVPFPIQGTGRETRSFLFIEDCIDGFMTLLERGKHGEIYHLGSSEEVAVGRLARMVAEYFGRRVQVRPDGSDRGGPARRCPDISKLSALGFRPKVSLREGLPVLARWYVEHAPEAPAS